MEKNENEITAYQIYRVQQSGMKGEVFSNMALPQEIKISQTI